MIARPDPIARLVEGERGAAAATVGAQVCVLRADGGVVESPTMFRLPNDLIDHRPGSRVVDRPGLAGTRAGQGPGAVTVNSSPADRLATGRLASHRSVGRCAHYRREPTSARVVCRSDVHSDLSYHQRAITHVPGALYLNAIPHDAIAKPTAIRTRRATTSHRSHVPSTPLGVRARAVSTSAASRRARAVALGGPGGSSSIR